MAGSLYEGVVEPSFEKPSQADANHAGHSNQNIGEAALSCTLHKKGDIAGKRRKLHVDSLTGKSKTYLIHGPGHSSEECKVLGDFGTKYAKIRPTKDRGSSPLPRKKS